MSDYDLALDIDPNNFIGHYNRGLLRARVGDDNRAIEDFDFVIQMEPDNMMAIFNRALLRAQTGDYRALSKTIRQLSTSIRTSSQDIIIVRKPARRSATRRGPNRMTSNC